MKKVAIIGTAGVPGKYGGFETLVHHFIQEANSEFELTIYCSKTLYPKDERVESWHGAKLHYLPFNANGAQSVIYDIVSVLHAIFHNEVLLILGVSGGLIFPFIKLFTNKVIIVNIDGLEWKRDKWNPSIRKFLKFSEQLAMKYSHEDITDNIALQRYTAEEYGTQSNLIEYGADHVNTNMDEDVDFTNYDYVSEYIGENKGNYSMKVCRIEPENNIHIVLQAFAEVEKEHLLIIGNWKYSEYGTALKEKYNTYKNITLYDPIYNQKILDQIRGNCKNYIHGHSAGGTNPSLIEAMYLGLPIIAFHVIYNKETSEFKAKYFKDIESLKNILISTSVEERHAIGENMRDIAKRRYTWKIVSEKYVSLIKSTTNLTKKSKINLNQ